jgi:protein TonB
VLPAEPELVEPLPPCAPLPLLPPRPPLTVIVAPVVVIVVASSTIAPPAPPPPPPAPPRIEPARARANLASYVSDADYPASAIRAEEQGTTGFRLTVGPDGRVTACSVTSSSGSAALDQATCRIMRSRARFTPARDDHGQATTDSVSSRIRWVLPDE